MTGALGSVRNTRRRRTVQWTGAGTVLALAAIVVLATLRALTGHPHQLGIWFPTTAVLILLGWIIGLTVSNRRAAAVAFVEAVAVSGTAVLVCAVYLVVVVGIEGTPTGHERSILAASLIAAAVIAVLGVPVRHRLVQWGDQTVGGREPSRAEVVSGFGARMSRAIPMDELMLQLAESLHETMASAAAEIWTGTDGQLGLAVSVPSRQADRLQLGEQERVVVGRARIGGPAWTRVWLPAIHIAGGDHRAVPVAHLGELLGLIVVARPADAMPFSEDDESALVELARQLGLALHNVRLDSALQASMAELAERNDELQASRLRIVTAADSSRRAIERNLHDGAQQHLVALAVKLGLARSIAEEGDAETVLGMLDDLRADVQTTIGELRELAHGIYPPLLRDRGLGEALRTAAARSPLPCTVDVDLPGRYPEEVETAAYFCCLEAMQNAGKYAGDGATIAVRVSSEQEQLCFELRDDGAGFEQHSTPMGHGFENMADRLGAIGGRLDVESKPGHGTTVRAVIPATPVLQPA
ncbi:MAG TPA: histidine kinase [Jatrophihabitantaceae bacterium]|jgi:signal transduction histidine kinase